MARTRITKIKKIEKITTDFESTAKPKRRRRRKEIDVRYLVPSGSTTFNLECSGRVEGAFQLGKLVNIIGDSHSGKTLLALTLLAECSLLKRFKDYRFLFDDVEAANEFDLEHLFGERVEKRIEQTVRSRTIEDFSDNVTNALEDDRPFIYVLDSFDALTSESALDGEKENKKLREKGKDSKGSYGDGKAKSASGFFSRIIQNLNDDRSLLIIISQTRDNIGFGAMFTPKTRSGGRALKFYAFHEIWLACQKKEKEGKRTVVTNVQAKITKNKLTGRHGEALFPILFDYGIDNIKSCINFLINEGPWTGKKNAINTQGFTPDKIGIKNLVELIESENREKELFTLCQTAYDDIMKALKPNRKRKY